LPPNVLSLGYQATGASEFGDLIEFSASPERYLTSATVAFSSWALGSDWGGGAGFLHPLSLNIYNVDSSSGTPQPGTMITSVTQAAFIPFRPEPSGGCPNNGWLGDDNHCYSGIAFTVQFDFDKILVPDQIIYGLAFNTQTYGSVPYGVDGPYNSLNVGLSTTGPGVGSRPFPDTAYVSSTAFLYTDGGLGGTGFLRQDTNWTPYSAAVSFSATTPEPGTAGLMIGAAAMLLWGYRRRTAKHLTHQ
jgi:hypothetical protein